MVSLVVWLAGVQLLHCFRWSVRRTALAEQLRQLWEKAATGRGLRSAAIDLRWQLMHVLVLARDDAQKMIKHAVRAGRWR